MNLKTLKSWKPGQSGNPAGRPRKYISTLKNVGYTSPEINQTLKNIIAMTEAELKAAAADKSATVLERIVAKSLKKSLKSSSLYNVETILTRALGKPIEAQPEQNDLPEDYAKLTIGELAERFSKNINKSQPVSSNDAGAARPGKTASRRTRDPKPST